MGFRSWTLTKVSSSYLSGLDGAVADSDKVCRYTMSPPQLARDAPVPARKKKKTKKFHQTVSLQRKCAGATVKAFR